MAVPVIPEFEVNVGKSKESKSFDFHFSAKLARTLAETLYDYKIEAVVREYSTNITDSHNDSGNEGLKGYVHIPTKLDPVIRFQDFGLGMDKGAIFNIYTKFGLSTKEHDNTTNGSLGYGSKSAFAVSEQFTVTSFKEGVKTVVVCYKDRTGLPTADLKSTTPSEEPNGTIVEIPVDLHKIEQWQKSAAFVLGAFRIPHEVNTFGVYQDEYNHMVDLCKRCREEGSVFIQDPSDELRRHRSNTFVLMGDVAYHLPDFNNLVMSSGVKSIAIGMIDRGLYVTSFDIGSLDHAPSREAISYDPETFKKVKHRVNSDILKYTRKLMEELEMSRDNQSFYSFYNKFKDSGVWSAIEKLQFPFLKGMTPESLDPRNDGRWVYNKVCMLEDEKTFGKIRGFIKGSASNFFIFSSAIHKLYQDRLLQVEDPVIVYSEKEKGLSKIRQTLDVIFKTYNEQRPVFYTEKKSCAENISKWFGGVEVVCGDPFSPQNTKEVSRKGRGKRGGFGIRNDHETVATVMTLLDTTYTERQEKVDLSEQGVYFTDGYDIEVTGVVKGEVTTLTLKSSKARDLLRVAGVNKVVFRNKNNSGKIKRSGINNVGDVVGKFVSKHKLELIKYSVWSDDTVMRSDDEIIASYTKEFKKLKSIISSSYSISDNAKIVRDLNRFSCFNLDKTPMWKRENDRRVALERKVETKVAAIKKKAPLLKHLSTNYPEDFEYYLRLEKVIK